MLIGACGLWFTACTAQAPSIVLSVKDQTEADDIALRAEVAMYERQGMDPQVMPGPAARQPARCQATRQPGVFVCRLVTKRYKSSPWVGRDARLRHEEGVWFYDPSLYDTIDGPYRLASTGSPASTAICYDIRVDCIERVPATVFSWGWNKAYVVAATHPRSTVTGEIDRSQTRYFYILRADDRRDAGSSAAVRGPLTTEAYQEEQRRLGLPPLGAYYPDLR